MMPKNVRPLSIAYDSSSDELFAEKIATAFPRSDRLERGRLLSSHEVLNNGQMRISSHSDRSVAPFLTSQPFNGVVAVLSIYRAHDVHVA